MKALLLVIALGFLTLPAHANQYINAEDAISSYTENMMRLQPTYWFYGKTKKGQDCRISLEVDQYTNTLKIAYGSKNKRKALALRSDGLVEVVYKNGKTKYKWHDFLGRTLYSGKSEDGKTILGFTSGLRTFECRN